MERTPSSFLDLAKNPSAVSVEEPEVAFELIIPGAKVPLLFGESWAYPCTPQIGVYTPDSYDPALPIALLGVPITDEEAQLPPEIAKLLARAKKLNFVTQGQTELYFVIHSGLQGGTQCCQRFCYNRDEFNLMMHAWAFANDDVADSHDAIVCWLLMYVRPLFSCILRIRKALSITAACPYPVIRRGLFHGQGVEPVHQEGYEGGLCFDTVRA